MSTVRLEFDGSNNLASVYLWLSQHRGEVLELDRNRRLILGVPISGARAVIVAVVLQDDLHPGPQIGGILRALSTRADSEPAHLVFEGRSPAGLSSDEANKIAAEVVHVISQQIASESAIANVA